MDSQFIRRLYFRELGKRNRQNRRTHSQATLLTLLGGVLFYVIQEVWVVTTFYDYTALVACLLACGCYVLSISYTLLASVGYEYAKLPNPDKLYEFWKKLKQYYLDHDESLCNASEDMNEYMIRKMIESTAINERNSYSRSARYYRSTQCLVMAIVLVTLAGTILVLQSTYL